MLHFFVDPSQIEGAHIYLEDKEDVKHLTKVLRAKVGELVSISDGVEWEYMTEIEDISSNSVILRITDKQKFAKEPKTKITLYQGVPKLTKMETVIQKNIEAGIFKIVPVFTKRVIVVEHDNFKKKLERWQKIAQEAVKQCQRGIIPEITDKKSFKEMMNELNHFNYDLIICPYENENNLSMKDSLRNFVNSSEYNKEKDYRVAVIIGPEGGFSDDEIDELKNIGANIVTLGKTILRTETAGLVATSMIMYELEL